VILQETFGQIKGQIHVPDWAMRLRLAAIGAHSPFKAQDGPGRLSGELRDPPDAPGRGLIATGLLTRVQVEDGSAQPASRGGFARWSAKCRTSGSQPLRSKPARDQPVVWRGLRCGGDERDSNADPRRAKSAPGGFWGESTSASPLRVWVFGTDETGCNWWTREKNAQKRLARELDQPKVVKGRP
jgi:hypothetical protein